MRNDPISFLYKKKFIFQFEARLIDHFVRMKEVWFLLWNMQYIAPRRSWILPTSQFQWLFHVHKSGMFLVYCRSEFRDGNGLVRVRSNRIWTDMQGNINRSSLGHIWVRVIFMFHELDPLSHFFLLLSFSFMLN